MDMTLRDQGGGGAVLLLRDASTPYYTPAATVPAARVVLYARDKGKGVDAAFILAEGKPGGEFSIPYAALTGRTLETATVSYSSSGTPSVPNLEHANWQDLEVTVPSIEIDEVTVTNFAATDGEINNIVSDDIAGALIKGEQMRIGTGGTVLTKMLKGAVTIDPASIAAGAVSTQTFTLTGAATGDALQLNPPTAGLTAGLIVLQSWVSAVNQISIVFQNTTGAPVDEPSASWTFTLIRS